MPLAQGAHAGDVPGLNQSTSILAEKREPMIEPIRGFPELTS
jgi:hypothetical protein